MIDSHCHLADDAFSGDLAEAIGRARQAGVTDALCILAAGDAPEAARGRRVQASWPGIRFATGVHPHTAGSFAGRPADAATTTREQAAAFGACAIGEIGLDYHYDLSPRDVQREVFAAQIALAADVNQPIIIHTREAADDTFALLKEAGNDSVRGVFHCFTGDVAMARRALDVGFYLSFAGIVTFPKAADLREAARLVPEDRLLIETDSPYLAPVPHRGQRNEPAFVPRVLAALAEVRGADPAALEAAIDRNFGSLFVANLSGRTA